MFPFNFDGGNSPIQSWMQIDILQQHTLEFLPYRSLIVKAEFVEMYIF